MVLRAPHLPEPVGAGDQKMLGSNLWPMKRRCETRPSSRGAHCAAVWFSVHLSPCVRGLAILIFGASENQLVCNRWEAVSSQASGVG